ncbi:MAG TPA: efflux RND transporter periplasmic adaptor subunit, partial [Nitrospiria bacterium]
AGVILAMMGSVALLAGGCGRNEAASPTEKQAVPVEVLEVHPEPFRETVASSAVAQAHEEYRVSAQVDGMLLEQNVDRGDRVTKDQVLFRFDPEPFDLRVRERSAVLAQAESRLKFIKQEFSRKEPLFRNNTLSEAQWDKVQFDLSLAEAERDQARVALEQAERDLRLSTVRSPVIGQVLERYHETGEVLPRGTALARIVDSSRIILEVGLSDRELIHIKKGNRIPVRVDAFPERAFSGEVTRISPNANPSTGSFPVEITVSNPRLEILPGMVARVDLPGEEDPARILIPLMAVRQQPGGAVVFVVEEGRAVQRLVTLGRIMGDRVHVVEGIVDADQIVLLGQGRIESGDRVNVIR